MADTRDPGAFQDEDPRKSISAAPSFEEYLKQREQGGSTSSAVATPAAAPAAAVAEPSSSSSTPSIIGDVDAASAIATLEASQTQLVATIASTIPDLAVKPDASICPSTGGFAVAGHGVKLDASDAAGPANIAWLADLCIDETMSSLTIFNGPLTDVPHLISRCAISNGDTLNFYLDFRPRAYGAYDLRDAEGNYPGPDTLGRKAFEYSGARKDFDTKFCTEDVVSYFGDIESKFEDATKNPISNLPETETLTRGPLAIDVSMPLTAANVDTIFAAREKAANLWLQWVGDDENTHRPGAQVNAQYVYDSKYKINCYGALLDVYVNLFGQSDGEKLAAADSGPIDEAYVGGGS